MYLVQYHKTTNFDEPHRTIFNIFAYLEAVSLILSTFLLILAGYYIKFANVHENLTSIMLYMFVDEPLYPSNDLPQSQRDFNAVVFWCSFYRIFYLLNFVMASLMAAVERYFATIFVCNYEKIKRRWIAVLIIGSSIIGSFSFTFIVHFDVLSSLTLSLFGLFLNLCSYLAFIGMYAANRRNLKRVKMRAIQNKYTLSLRFQLNENLNVMKWLKTIFTASNIVNFVLGVFYTVSNDRVLRYRDPLLCAYLYLVINHSIVLYSWMMVVGIFMADPRFRQRFLTNATFHRISAPIFGRCFPADFSQKRSLTVTEESNIYFTTLKSQWETFEVSVTSSKSTLRTVCFGLGRNV
ncbi:unnamed protein product [Caenorhabditis bovis]|uniref:Uncharacterized protein n=1 Tax=Caenorhabditis bovis TaxID=2654633 RepID=A0A8S1ENE2_9PELO|nr:unnamed protein product [Caenorhabditis bovis]